MAKDMKHAVAEVKRLLNEGNCAEHVQQVLDLTTAEMQRALYLYMLKQPPSLMGQPVHQDVVTEISKPDDQVNSIPTENHEDCDEEKWYDDTDD